MTPWAVWAVVRSLSIEGNSTMLSVLAFTPYAAATAPVPLLVALWLRRRWAAAVAFTAALALAVTVLPRAWADDQPPIASGVTVTIMSLNMNDGKADPATIARLVREHEVDMLGLLELKSGLERLERTDVDERLPGRLVSPRSRGGGSTLLARLPLLPTSQQGAGELAAPPTADTVVQGAKLTVTLSHPPHPTTGEAVERWRAELRELPSATDGPLQIIMGDLNATLDHYPLRELIDRGYRDAAEAVGEGLVTTWPTRGRLLPRIGIDHVLADRRIVVRDFEAATVPGTDHRAVIAVLKVPV